MFSNFLKCEFTNRKLILPRREGFRYIGKGFKDERRNMEMKMDDHQHLSLDESSQVNSSVRWGHSLPLATDNSGLRKFLRIIVISLSLIIMIDVVLCFTFVLPQSRKKERSTLEISSASENIGLVCQATQNSDLCFASLESDSRSSGAGTSMLLMISIGIASTGVKRSLHMASEILKTFRSDVNISAAARDCEEVLSYSLQWLLECKNADIATHVEDVQAWLSAVLTYQNDCNSSLTYVNNTDVISQAMVQVQSVIPFISNALSMVDAYASYGPDPVNWKAPSSGREAMSPDSSSAWKLVNHKRHLLDAPQEPSVVVSPDMSAPFHSVQHAIDNAPDNSQDIYVIHVKEGKYRERVRIPQNKIRLMLIGDGMGKTVITGDLSIQPGVNTMDSATIIVSGSNFIAQDLTIENTAGPEAHQAVALRVDSDKSAFQRVEFLGYQDTLYVHTLRQFYRDCIIEGTVDFIFGNAAALFENCSLRVRVGRPGVRDSMVTAQGRTDPAQTTGLIFHRCSIEGSAQYDAAMRVSPGYYRAWLGRPWKLFSRTIFIETYMGELVQLQGWLPWNGDYALATLFYAEYDSRGPGGNSSGRVPWSLQLTADQILAFSVQHFIQGDQWLPEASIPLILH